MGGVLDGEVTVVTGGTSGIGLGRRPSGCAATSGT